QLLIKPFDASSVQAIAKGIETSGLGLNPQVEGKTIRLVLPALSGERRNQLITSVKQMGEQAKVTIRNARRDGNKQLDKAAKDKEAHVSEDEISGAKDDVQELTRKYEAKVDEMIDSKIKEVQEI
ncbi:MAG: ribosome-recycling factor, partial [Phycisphaeraceae bacterium]